MKIQYSDIPEGGVHVALRAESGRWDGLRDFSVESGPRGHLYLRKRGTDVYIEGEVDTTLWLECSRCLEKFPFSLHAEVSQLLRPEPSGPLEAKEIELSPQDFEYAAYDGENIALEAIVEDHLLLSLPMQPLCGEACKGLCPGCGVNLNHGECECPEDSMRSPFDCLKEFVVKER